ncbi:uncharacterized protein [Spinacia oleracea]|uniref:Reverse transcriptase domain-containing protein n=1 Tax=Spinacia oleracea TaxID=3562 RepID=A0ABM3RIU5_SPIOL|nr:uncharacterized protein LOC130469981 [Spinacia oleracea]
MNFDDFDLLQHLREALRNVQDGELCRQPRSGEPPRVVDKFKMTELPEFFGGTDPERVVTLREAIKYREELFEEKRLGDIFVFDEGNEDEEVEGYEALLFAFEHQIDLVPGSSLPNKAAYRCNPEETKELKKQINELKSQGYVRESLSPCDVPFFLVPKEDGTWRMCVDSRAVNNITI